LKALISLVIPSSVHAELDVAIDNVEKLLVAPPAQLQQAQTAGIQKWQMFAKASPAAANTLAMRWQDDRFAERMASFYLAGLADHACPWVLQWMGTLSEQDWKDFLEIMKVNPGMQKWLVHHRQPVPASHATAQARQKEDADRRRRILLNQQSRIRIR
jgi:hypothetical protein